MTFARGQFTETSSPDAATPLYPGQLWRWDGPDLRWDVLPVLGGDNEAVFRGLLAMSDDDYAQLEADGNLSLDYLAPDGSPL